MRKRRLHMRGRRRCVPVSAGPGRAAARGRLAPHAVRRPGAAGPAARRGSPRDAGVPDAGPAAPVAHAASRPDAQAGLRRGCTLVLSGRALRLGLRFRRTRRPTPGFDGSGRLACGAGGWPGLAGSARFGSARFGSARLGSVRLGSVRLTSFGRFGSPGLAVFGCWAGVRSPWITGGGAPWRGSSGGIFGFAFGPGPPAPARSAASAWSWRSSGPAYCAARCAAPAAGGAELLHAVEARVLALAASCPAP